MGFDWGPIFSAGLQGALQFGGQLFQNKANDEAADKRFQQDKDMLAYKAELAAGMPHAGGGAGPFTGFTDPQRVQAMQNQNQQYMSAINAIIKNYQTALLSK